MSRTVDPALSVAAIAHLLEGAAEYAREVGGMNPWADLLDAAASASIATAAEKTTIDGETVRWTPVVMKAKIVAEQIMRAKAENESGVTAPGVTDLEAFRRKRAIR